MTTLHIQESFPFKKNNFSSFDELLCFMMKERGISDIHLEEISYDTLTKEQQAKYHKAKKTSKDNLIEV